MGLLFNLFPESEILQIGLDSAASTIIIERKNKKEKGQIHLNTLL
jgi:hypothetical protein